MTFVAKLAADGFVNLWAEDTSFSRTRGACGWLLDRRTHTSDNLVVGFGLATQIVGHIVRGLTALEGT